MTKPPIEMVPFNRRKFVCLLLLAFPYQARGSSTKNTSAGEFSFLATSDSHKKLAAYNFLGEEVIGNWSKIENSNSLMIERDKSKKYGYIEHVELCRISDSPKASTITSVEIGTVEIVLSQTFVGIDAALSWLVKPDRRSNYLEWFSYGLGPGAIIRERLDWAAINPERNSWNWDSDSAYESLRRQYARMNLFVLEMFHSAPARLRDGSTGPYPSDLIETAEAWSVIAQRWAHIWGGLEVWNEPDSSAGGGGLSADQYVPVVKAVRYALSMSGVNTPLLAGALTGFDRNYLEVLHENGLFEFCDCLSFHYYGSPLKLEEEYSKFRSWLDEKGFQAMEIWITEIGTSWHGEKHSRPNIKIQRETALRYAMQIIEAKALGIERVFPFVAAPYAEQGGTKQYGIFDESATPLRSYAAVIFAAKILAGRTYIGTMHLPKFPNVTRVRVFSEKNLNCEAKSVLVVIYFAKIDLEFIRLPFDFCQAYGVDGRNIINSAVDLTVKCDDGMAYIESSPSAILELLIKAHGVRTVDRLPSCTGAQKSSLIVAAHIGGPALHSILPNGYLLHEKASDFKFIIRIFNMQKAPREVIIYIGGISIGSVYFSGQGKNEFETTMSVDSLEVHSDGVTRILRIRACEEGGICESAVLRILISSPIKSISAWLKGRPYHYPLPIADVSQWQLNTSGEISASSTESNSIIFSVRFQEGSDRWAYPRIRMPLGIAADVDGLLMRVRSAGDAKIRVFAWLTHGAHSFTHQPIAKADGQWHVVYLKIEDILSDLPINQRRFVNIRDIAVGVNSQSNSAFLEISELILVGPPIVSPAASE